ncbi:MAG: flavodoxin family protein [Candidatus Aminicenantes bacterium]|nr:flavodoxin family protein [Candidatus Aminicenantes bacterium]
MSKTLVTYVSQTQNTKTVAEAIHDAVQGEKSIKPIEDIQNEDLIEFSLIFIGFPVHSHSIPYKVESLIKRLPPKKKIALFSTHGSLTGGRLAREALEYATVVGSHTQILGTFSCRGKVSAHAREVLSKSPEHTAWAEMAASAHNHPDEHDLADAGSFAKWVQTLFAQK